MPTSHDIQRLILRALEYGPHNMYEIAEVIDQAPFRVRAELRVLKRGRYVKGMIGSDRYVWEITDLGRRILSEGRQMRIA